MLPKRQCDAAKKDRQTSCQRELSQRRPEPNVVSSLYTSQARGGLYPCNRAGHTAALLGNSMCSALNFPRQPHSWRCYTRTTADGHSRSRPCHAAGAMLTLLRLSCSPLEVRRFPPSCCTGPMSIRSGSGNHFLDLLRRMPGKILGNLADKHRR